MQGRQAQEVQKAFVDVLLIEPVSPHVAADARDGLEHVLDVRGIAGIGLSHSDAACASTALL